MSRPNRWVGLETDDTIRSGPHPWVRKFLRGSGFLIRHGIASVLTIAIPCLLWIVVYFACLLWAILWNEPLGGPLALPAGILFFFVTFVIAVTTALFPSVALAEWIGRKRDWPILAQIPLSITLMAAIAGVFSLFSNVEVALAGFLLLLIPLGIYWWIAQSGPLLLSGWRWMKRRAKI